MMPFLDFLAEYIIIIYSREKSLKCCENMSIYQVTEGSVAKLQLTMC